MHIYKGKDAVKEALMLLAQLREHEKFYIYMGARAAGHLLALFGKEFVVFMHSALVEKKLIAVSFRSDLTQGVLSRDVSIKDTYKGRVSLYYVLPEDSFSEYSAVYAFRDSVLMVNFKEVVAYHVHDKEYFLMITKLLHLSQTLSKREVIE